MLLLSALLLFSPTCSADEYSARYDSAIKSAVAKWWLDWPADRWHAWKAQLYVESALNPDARSPVGAEGLGQAMPGTWADIIKALNYPKTVSRRDAAYAIEGTGWYQAQLRHTWRRGRDAIEANRFGQASYNRGTGNILRDQKECGGSLVWADVAPCTAKHTMETVNYVTRIERIWREMEK